MEALLAAIGSALWLGILTSISPCPLATNVAAVSYVARSVESPRRVLFAGLLYAAGRALAYVALGVLLVESLVGTAGLSRLLERYVNQALGPMLILVGLLLLDLLRFAGPGTRLGARLGERLASAGVAGAAPLGVLFALSFCPVSAGLFFLGLVPLAVRQGSGVWLPMVFGVGTAVPVVLFALAVSLGARSLGLALRRTTVVARWARLATGLVFVGTGIYLALVYVYEVA